MGKNHSRFGPAFGLAAALLFAGNAAQAQMSANPPEVGRAIFKLGRSLDPAVAAATAALYAPLQNKPPFPGVRIHRNLKYGPDGQNRLDVFAPDPPPEDAVPVLMFVHGGDFVAGDKDRPGSPFYDNIGVWAATHGLIGINIDYRLAPQHPWPAAIEDLGAAISWAIRNVAPYGGDPEKIFAMGHSAGATHIADYVSHPALQPPAGAGIAGAILLSGIYDLTADRLVSSEKAYFGEDPARYVERSSLRGLAEAKLPLLVAVSEFDVAEAVEQANRLNKFACERHHCLRFIVLPQHSHLSEVYSIGTRDVLLTNTILGFIKKN